MENKTKWTYIAIIAVLIALLFIQHSCQGDGETKTTTTVKDVNIIVPGKDGQFDTPTNQTELPSQGKDSILIYDKIVYVESKVNEELKAKLEKSEDKYSLLLDAVRERDYVTEFEDDNIKMRISTKVEGNLVDLKPIYNIKPQTVTLQEKTITKETTISSKFALYAGVNAQTNTSLGKIAPGADIGVQINNKTILSAGINTDKDVTVGVKFRIFNIKK